MKKQSLCWFYNNKDVKLSSDRNSQVKESSDRQPFKFRNKKINEVDRFNKIYIQDYCVFQRLNSEECLIGSIKEFGFIDKTT